MVLEVNNVRKAFGRTQVLKGVDLRVNKGDVVAILGPSGSGKTTLLRCLNFLERADEGTLRFGGEEFQLGRVSQKDVARLRNRTAFVFQSYNLFLNKTALQNVMEGLIVGRKMPRDRAEEIGRRALSKVGMADRMNHYPSQLSGGEQQRVAIARALVKNPKLLLCDEPTGALDYKTGKQVLQVLQDTCRNNRKTVVMITHNSALAPMGDKIIHVKSGKIESVTMNPHPVDAREIEY